MVLSITEQWSCVNYILYIDLVGKQRTLRIIQAWKVLGRVPYACTIQSEERE